MTFAKRILAYAIDLTIESVVFMGMLFIVQLLYTTGDFMEAQAFLFSGLVLCAYLVIYLPTVKNGQTIGKMITRQKVVNENHKPRTYVQNATRELFYKYIFCLPLILICIIQTLYSLIRFHDLDHANYLHDSLTKTEVVAA